MNRYLNLILLAAGSGERFGSNKLLKDINGKPLYRHVFDHLNHYYREHVADCEVTVVSQYSEILEAAVSAGFAAVRNPRPEDGISLTIRLGLEAGSENNPGRLASFDEDDHYQGEGAAFFTADQPYMRYETIENFLQLAHRTQNGMVSAVNNGVSGNPVFFDRSYYPELMELTGDIGGKRVMNRHLDDVEWFEMSREELMDIDTPEDGDMSNRIRNLSE